MATAAARSIESTLRSISSSERAARSPSRMLLKEVAKRWQRAPLLLVPLTVVQAVLARVQGHLAGLGACA